MRKIPDIISEAIAESKAWRGVCRVIDFSVIGVLLFNISWLAFMIAIFAILWWFGSVIWDVTVASGTFHRVLWVMGGYAVLAILGCVGVGVIAIPVRIVRNHDK